MDSNGIIGNSKTFAKYKLQLGNALAWFGLTEFDSPCRYLNIEN